MPIPAAAERSNASRRVRMRIEDSDMNTSPLLFGQCILAVNVEVASRNRRCCLGLTSADADGVITLRNDRIAIFRDHAQIARLQVEMDLLARAQFEMDASKAAQSNARSSLDLGELEIELHHLITRGLANIGDRDIGAEGLSGGNRRSGNTQIAIAKLRITQSIAEGIERLAAEVAIGPVCHPVVFEVRQLIDTLVKGDGEPAGRVVFAAQRL